LARYDASLLLQQISSKEARDGCSGDRLNPANPATDSPRTAVFLVIRTNTKALSFPAAPVRELPVSMLIQCDSGDFNVVAPQAGADRNDSRSLPGPSRPPAATDLTDRNGTPCRSLPLKVEGSLVYILIVEDNKEAAEVLCEIFPSEAYSVQLPCDTYKPVVSEQPRAVLYLVAAMAK
jgi:hypothetical protein